MRKTFKFICAAVVAAFAVSSCYDDSKLWTELEELDQRVTSLETALNADVANLATLDASHKALDKAVKDLEAALKAAAEAGDKTNSDAIKALQAEVAALQAQLAGVKVENKNGAVVVTIGKDSFTLSQNGVLTIVEEDGVKYWALVDPATGKVTNLEVKVGHDLKFKVDPKTAEVLVSYDGVEYVGTGVYAAEDSATLIGEVEETDDAVTITIGDATYTLAKWSDDKSVLGLSRADFYLMYGATKVVELTATDIAEYYVMAKPDGWKASFEGKTLTVVAPAKKTYELGAAEAEGEILVHATTVDGKCKVAKLDVKTGDGLTLEIDAEGNLVINNAFVGQNGNEEVGYTYDFMDFRIGLVSMSELLGLVDELGEYFNETDPYVIFEKAHEEMQEAYVGFEAGFYNWYAYHNENAKSYEESVYEVDHIEASIFDLYDNSWKYMVGGDLPHGPYVVWAVSQDQSGNVGGMRFAEFNYLNIDVQVLEAKHNDLKVSIVAEGADEYLIGWMSESMMNGGGGVGPLAFSADSYAALDQYMLGQFGPWGVFTKYGSVYSMAPQFYMPLPADVIPSAFPSDGVFLSTYQGNQKFGFNETCYIWVMPMFDFITKYDSVYDMYDYSAYDYNTHFKPYVFAVNTNDIQAGSSVTVTLGEAEVGYGSVSVPVSAEGAEVVYYSYFTNDEYNEFSNDAEILAAVFENCEWPVEGAEGILENDSMKHGEAVNLAVVALDADGKYSTLVTKSYKTLTVDRNEASVSIVSVVDTGEDEFTASFNVTGATKVYALSRYPYDEPEEEEAAIRMYETQILDSNCYGLMEASVVDGTVTLPLVEAWDATDYIYVWACNVDTNGNIVDMQAKPLVFNIGENLAE